MPVSRFENTVRENGHTVLWQGQIALVGPYRVSKRVNAFRKLSRSDCFPSLKELPPLNSVNAKEGSCFKSPPAILPGKK